MRLGEKLLNTSSHLRGNCAIRALRRRRTLCWCLAEAARQWLTSSKRAQVKFIEKHNPKLPRDTGKFSSRRRRIKRRAASTEIS